MNIKKRIIIGGIVASLLFSGRLTESASAQAVDPKNLDYLYNEAISRDWDRANNAIMKLVEKRQWDLMHQIFWQLDPSLRQSAAGYLTASGDTSLNVDLMLLQYYKSTNVPVAPGDHESANARNFGTYQCLKYLSGKYKIPIGEYRPQRATTEILGDVAEAISRLEAVIISGTLSLTPSGSRGNATVGENLSTNADIQPLQTSVAAEAQADKQILIRSGQNSCRALLIVSIFLNCVFVWLKLKKRP